MLHNIFSLISVGFYSLSLTIIGVLLVIICFLITPPVLLVRYFVYMCAKLFEPELGSIVSGLDIIFGWDFQNWHTNPNSVLVMTSILQSSSDSLEKALQFFHIYVQDPNYKRLRQYIVPFMGFAFWKEDNDFDIKCHVKYYRGYSSDSPPVDDKWVNQFKKTLLKTPFGKNKSPWEFIIVPNYKFGSSLSANHSIMFFRCQHALGDGISFVDLTYKMCEHPLRLEKPLEKTIRINSREKIFKVLFSLIKAPYDIARISIEANDKGKTPWCTHPNQFTGVNNYARSKPFPVNDLKIIRDKFNVSFVPVVLWGITTILRNAMIAKNIKIPNFVYCHMPLPLPNHPKKMCNHMTIVLFPLPVGTSDSLKRLQRINSEYETLKSSSDPLLVLLFLKVLGKFPYWVVRNNKNFVTILATIFPTSPQYQDLFGSRIEEKGFALSVPVPLLNSGILIGCVTYKDVITFETNADSSILASDEEIEEIHQIMYKEMDDLKFWTETEFIL